ncbi:hypothetical protein JMJ77_0002399 [Colletotrichum scovillei]|uniref:Uncharacterized protein n=1 Tax=Colletotrichum scovillei TaxID=1209932 RepID=A0A9P7UDJ7_9PEZI|nr:hypothetical protein JMJ77_0002399 [Colletotrichum scovillei]KAG7070818.1 hypothetical protein JMJ76_0002063 [Colletotrichum scovillei]KAG7079059.1 hypothetical protein JMJ78_0002721 [Colletotrichum scovillei]
MLDNIPAPPPDALYHETRRSDLHLLRRTRTCLPKQVVIDEDKKKPTFTVPGPRSYLTLTLPPDW